LTSHRDPELDEARRQVQHLRAALSSLVTGLRNPLVSIETFLGLFARHHEDPDFRGRMLEITRADLERVREVLARASAVVDGISAAEARARLEASSLPTWRVEGAGSEEDAGAGTGPKDPILPNGKA